MGTRLEYLEKWKLRGQPPDPSKIVEELENGTVVEKYHTENGIRYRVSNAGFVTICRPQMLPLAKKDIESVAAEYVLLTIGKRK